MCTPRSQSVLKRSPLEILEVLLSHISIYKNNNYQYVPLAYKTDSNWKFSLSQPFKGTLRDIQSLLVDQIKEKTCLLNLPTGFGKTIIGLYLASSIQGNTLVLIPRSIIFDQWKDRLNQFLPLNESVTLEPEIAFYNKMKTMNENTFIEQYECVIIDECHMNTNLVFTKILPKIKCNILIGLTASYVPDNDQYYIHYFKQILRKHETKVFLVIPIQLDFVPKISYIWREGRNQLDYTSMMKSLTSNDNRLLVIREFITKLIIEEPTCKILVLVKNINTINFIKNIHVTNNTELIVDTMSGSKNDWNRDSDILIGTYQKMGVGFDSFCFTKLVLLDNVKDIIQAEGRLRNQDFTIYDLIDDHDIFRNHWSQRRNWYVKRGGSVNKITHLKI
jgi:hypothetical protein